MMDLREGYHLVSEEFKASPDVEFLYGDFYAIDESGELISKIKTIPFDPNILLYGANFISQPASFYRRTLLDKIGLFNDTLQYLMDYEFFLRAASFKINFKLVRSYLSAIRYHEQCKTINGVEPWANERIMIKEKYVKSGSTSPKMMRFRSLLYRLKRYGLLIGRGRIDFSGLVLSYKRRYISKQRKPKI